MYTLLPVKNPLFLSDINETWFFSADFRKNSQIPNYRKISPVRVELFNADGRTNRHDEANGRFLQFGGRAYQQRLFPYTTLNDWFFITEKKSVYCAVRTE
jgi:hypothetical protein